MLRIFILLAVVSISSASTYKPNNVDNEIINLSFNDNFAEAKELAERQINLNPESPKYYYYRINAMVLEYFERIMALERDKRDEGRKRINEEIISYLEDVAEKFEDKQLSLEDKFYYGTILGYLARMQGLDGSWWGAFSTGMDAQELMEEIIEADPEFYDAYLLLGMFEYYADRLSGFVSVIAGVLGFSGDRDTGLEYLNLALAKGTLTFGQTALTLIEIYAQLEDNDYKALPYYKKFLSEYPRNKRILNSYVHELINTWDFSTADSIISNDSHGLVNDYSKVRYYNKVGNSELAIKYASNVLDNKNTNWRGMTRHAQYIYTFENWMLGNDKAVQSSKDSLAEYMHNRFNEITENKDAALWIRKLTLAIVANDESAITKQLSSKPAFNDTTDFNNEFNSLMGDYHFKRGLYKTAEESFLNIAKSNRDDLKYYAYKQLVEIYTRTDARKQNVEWLVDKIDDFDNDRLSFRARDLEKKYGL